MNKQRSVAEPDFIQWLSAFGGTLKAEITKNGLLKISAETELEAYALRHWLEDNAEAAVANQLFVYGLGESEFIG